MKWNKEYSFKTGDVALGWLWHIPVTRIASHSMKYIADFHIHSHYSRATSKEMNVVSLYKWGQIKGIQVMGTGDFTHPAWLNEMREKLEEAEPGLYTLKPECADKIIQEIPQSCRNIFRFMLTGEISCIYSKGGKVRKIHCVVAAPDFATAARINAALSRIGNLQADGRPILGLDAKELLRIVLDASPSCLFIPAHVWTPHFGVLGASSGFQSLEECFEDLTPQLTAIETGLSSDPAMNWRLSALDSIALVSNSDAHSPGKLGREANRFDTELSYAAIQIALRNNDPARFLETLEFYPEEGKYHMDGHSGCHVSLKPAETAAHNGKCPRCGKAVTVGVMNRVQTLADRPERYERKQVVPFRSLVPLPEILANVLDCGPTSKKVMTQYLSLIQQLGNEFEILLDTPLIDIEKASSPVIADGIRRMREGRIHVTPGYDGEYGTISVFTPEERTLLEGQPALF